MTSERKIRKDAFVHCAFSAALGCAERFMRVAAAQGGLEELVVPAPVAVLVTEDFTDTVRRHDALEFQWYPRSFLLPAGRALLTVRPHAPEGTQLQFSIAYVPPFGALGQMFDFLVGRHIAARTCDRVLQRLKVEIECLEVAGARYAG
jgi:hypothetical protein